MALLLAIALVAPLVAETRNQTQPFPVTGAVTAVILAPEPGQIVSNVLSGGTSTFAVRGHVAGAGLKGWALDVGAGADPSGWTSITSGMSPVGGGVLADWRTGLLPNGTFTVRLLVRDEAGPPRVATTTVQLANFSMSHDVLQLDGGADARVTYTSIVPFALRQRVLIKDQQGRTVRTLLDAHREAGTYRDSWDARNDAGERVPDGPYFYVATAETPERSMVWDLGGEYLNNFFDSKDGLAISSFDPFANRPLVMHYTTQVAGLTTVAVFNRGIQSHSCSQPAEKVLCLVQQRYERAGAHTFVWAGVDATGAYRGDAYSNISVATTRDRFARNAVVVFGTSPTIDNVRVEPPAFSPPLQEAAVSFDLATFQKQTAKIVVRFVNQASRSALRTLVLKDQPPGRVEASWDGRADNGVLVAPGAYTMTVTATDHIGNEVSGQILATIRH